MGKTFAEIRMEVEKALVSGEITEDAYADIMDQHRKDSQPIYRVEKNACSTCGKENNRFCSNAYHLKKHEGKTSEVTKWIRDEMTDKFYAENGWDDVKSEYNGVISDGSVPVVGNNPLVNPLVAALYCIDCFSMNGEKKYASMVGWGFSFCDEHAGKYIENQKKVNHEKWKAEQ